MVDLDHNLVLEIIAEGVENKEQLLFLQQFGCETIQGYFFSKPVNEHKIVELLQKKSLLSD